MIIKKSQRNLEVDEPDMKIFDYDLGTEEVGVSYQELRGRIPKEGQGKNLEVDEWYFVLEGTGTVAIDGQDFAIEQGDIVNLPKGSTSCLEANDMKILTITRPNWFEDQYRDVI